MTDATAAEFRSIKLGDTTIYSLSDGATQGPVRPGVIKNATMEQVRAALIDAGKSDTIARTPFTTIAIARNDDRLILIDSGTGGAPIYGPNCGHLGTSLAAAGLAPLAVQTILVTHLHGDHIFGLFERDTLAPRYPNAEIIVPAAELAWWTQPGVEALDLGATRVGLATAIRKTIAVWHNVRTFAEGAEVMPGIHAIPAYGHSPGHNAYLVRTGERDLLFSADICVNPTLLLKHPDWHFAMDQDPALAAATRRRLFDFAASENLLVTGTHWELPNIGYLERAGQGYAFAHLSV